MYPYGVMCPSCGEITPPSARAHECMGPSLALRRQAARTAIWLGEPIPAPGQAVFHVGQTLEMAEATYAEASKLVASGEFNTDTQITAT